MLFKPEVEISSSSLRSLDTFDDSTQLFSISTRNRLAVGTVIRSVLDIVLLHRGESYNIGKSKVETLRRSQVPTNWARAGGDTVPAGKEALSAQAMCAGCQNSVFKSFKTNWALPFLPFTQLIHKLLNISTRRHLLMFYT